jgi:hypothetical protein
MPSLLKIQNIFRRPSGKTRNCLAPRGIAKEILFAGDCTNQWLGIKTRKKSYAQVVPGK